MNTLVRVLNVVVLLASLALAEEAALPVCPLDTADGAQITWGEAVADKKMVPNADRKFISEGAASIHLSGVTQQAKGNKYLGVKLPIPKTDMTKHILLLDAWSAAPAAPQSVYVRLYDAAGKRVASWCNSGSPFKDSPNKTFHLNPAIAQDGFQYEEKVAPRQPLPDVAAVEIVIGTSADNAPIEIYVDNLRISKRTIVPFAEVTSPKRLFLKTPLVEGGKACAAIVSPSTPEYRSLARRIAERIKAVTGVEVSVVAEDAAPKDDLNAVHLILLGSICNNRLMVPLYGLRYALVDDAYPGGDGYVIRIVHDPWGTGKNAVILGGSSPAGVGKAADEFLAMLPAGKDLVLDAICRALPGNEETKKILDRKVDEKYIEDMMERARQALATGAHTGITGTVSNAGLDYGRTGDEIYAKLFKRLVYLMYEHRQSNPKTYGGPWGMDADFRLHTIIPAWDLVEESPVFTDEDRLKITQILFEFTVYCAPKAASCLTSKHVRHNHQTFPALGLFHAGTYFRKYYGIAEAEYWLDIAESAFGYQAKSAKPLEDCNGYQWLTLYHLMQYALAKPDWTYFENGNARRDADYAILCMDNLGYQVPYGDTGTYQCWWSEIPFLLGATWYYKDGRYQWATDKKLAITKRYPIGEYTRKVDPVEPADLLGAKAFPVEPMYYETFRSPNDPPIEKTVDKVILRASFSPERQYLLLDGLSNGGHKHYDGNTISRITDRGRIWLADNDYIKALPKFHNGVLIQKDGQSETIPPFCELEGVADLDDVAFSETVVRNYSGVDWHRTIVWLKEKYFLVADRMAAQEENDFSFNCKWHLVGKPALSQHALSLEQQGKQFFVKTTGDLQVKLSDDPELGKNWKGYEFADPVVRVLEEIGRARLRKGEQFTYLNLLHSSSGDAPLDFQICRAGKTGALITGGEGPALIGVAGGPEPDLYGRIEVKASAYRIAPSGFALANATALRCGGNSLFQSPSPVAIHCGGGKTILLASQRTTVEIALNNQAARQMTVEAGRTVLDGCPDLGGIAAEIAALAGSAAQAAVAGAPPAAEEKLPALKSIWTYREEISEVLVSGNRGNPRAWGATAAIACDPAPLPENVFSGKRENAGENLLDGEEGATGGCTMWAPDQPVTVTVDLKAPCDIGRLVLKAWWANSSSKGKTFQLDHAVVEVSNDAFAKDIREVGKIADTATHENWGGATRRPEVYELKDLKATASQVRWRLVPHRGTAVYLAEVEVWGKPQGAALTPAALTAKGIEFAKLTCACAADVNRDGCDEVVLGVTDGKVVCLSREGRPLWQSRAEAKVTCVCAVDFQGDGGRQIVAGAEDEKVYAFDGAGKVLWKFEIPKYKKKGCVRTVFPARLMGGKAEQVLAGADNWHYYALDATGKELWRYEAVHDATVGIAADTDNDGKDEVVAGTVYYWWPCINPDGSKKWAYSTQTGPIVNALAAGDLCDDARKEVIFGGADANLHVIAPDGKLLWQFNTADAVTAVKTCDVDGNGKDEVIAASMSFNVYAIKGDGKRIWRCELPEVVSDLALLDSDGDGKMEIAAACRNGKVYLLSLDGKRIAEFAAQAPVERLAVADLDGKGKRSLIMLCADGVADAVSR